VPERVSDRPRASIARSMRPLESWRLAECDLGSGSDSGGAMDHPNLELLRRGYAAYGAGDLETFNQLFADDVVWHVAGRSPVAGDYSGKEQVFGFFGKLQEMSDGTAKVEVHDLLADDTRRRAGNGVGDQGRADARRPSDTRASLRRREGHRVLGCPDRPVLGGRVLVLSCLPESCAADGATRPRCPPAPGLRLPVARTRPSGRR